MAGGWAPGVVVLALALVLAVAAPLASADDRPVVFGAALPLDGDIPSGQAGQNVDILAREYGKKTFGRIATVRTKAGGRWCVTRAPAHLHDLRRDDDRQPHFQHRHPRAPRLDLDLRRGILTVSARTLNPLRGHHVFVQVRRQGGAWHGVRKIVLGPGAQARTPFQAPAGPQRDPPLHAHPTGGRGLRRRLQRHPRVPQHRVACARDRDAPRRARRPAADDRGLLARAPRAAGVERVHARDDRRPPARRRRGGHRRGRDLQRGRPAGVPGRRPGARPRPAGHARRALPSSSAVSTSSRRRPRSPPTGYYRRWAFESAALDLALRQAGVSLGRAARAEPAPGALRRVDAARRAGDRGAGAAPPRPVPVARVQAGRDEHWDRRARGRAGGDRRGRVARPEGATTTARRSTRRPTRRSTARVAEGFPDAWIEDPALTPETAAVLEPHRDRVTWDAPIHSIADLEALRSAPRGVNLKPSRFGSIAALLETYDYCERATASSRTAAASSSSARAAARSSTSPRSSTPDAPNDVAPRPFNEPSSAPACPRARSRPHPRRPGSAGRLRQLGAPGQPWHGASLSASPSFGACSRAWDPAPPVDPGSGRGQTPERGFP